MCRRRHDDCIASRLVEDIEAWMFTDTVLVSDGELANLAAQEAVGTARIHNAILEDPPA